MYTLAEKIQKYSNQIMHIVIWLENIGNRLYGIMGLLSKMLARMGDGWMGDIPVTTTRAPVVLKSFSNNKR